MEDDSRGAWLTVPAIKELRQASCQASGLFLGQLLGERLPIDERCIGPEMFQVVECAAFGREDVQHDVAVVLENPSFGSAAFDTDTRTAAAFLHHELDVFGDGAHLATAGRGGHDKEIGDWRDRREIEHDSLFAFEVFAGLCGETGQLAAGLLALGQGRCGGFGAGRGGDGDVSENSEPNKGHNQNRTGQPC